MGFSEEQIAAALRLRADGALFSEKCLKIITKDGGKPSALIYNKAQIYAEEMANRMMRETGKVRLIILKGRKQGLLTWVGSRFYRRTSTNHGLNAQVLAHLDDSSAELFKMVRMYHDRNPMAPRTAKDSEKGLRFPDLSDSSYGVATAGSKDVGRGGTRQLLHCSEHAYWPNASDQMAAVGNMVADEPGTEIMLESTANGVGNLFYDLWTDAELGKNAYWPVFIPWFWEPSYWAQPPDDFEMTEEEVRYGSPYNLNAGQMFWRRMKIANGGRDGAWKFDREFPATPAHAFRTSTKNPLINPDLVSAAANSKFRPAAGGVVIIGVDPSEGVEGGDSTAFVWRRGRAITRIERFEGDECRTGHIVGKLANYWRNGTDTGVKPDAIIIDRGFGSGIIDGLRELNIPVIAVHFAGSAQDDTVYSNKRAEMGYALLDWFEDIPNVIPNDMGFMSEMSVTQGGKYDRTGRKLLESKKEMAKRGIKSPNYFDAAMLTLAENVGPRSDGIGYGAPANQSKPATAAGY